MGTYMTGNIPIKVVALLATREPSDLKINKFALLAAFLLYDPSQIDDIVLQYHI